MERTIEEIIRHKRILILIHSYLYYELGETIWEDYMFDDVAMELVELQNNNPEKCKIGFFDEAFSDFDGCTGYDLPYNDPYVVEKSKFVK